MRVDMPASTVTVHQLNQTSWPTASYTYDSTNMSVASGLSTLAYSCCPSNPAGKNEKEWAFRESSQPGRIRFRKRKAQGKRSRA